MAFIVYCNAVVIEAGKRMSLCSFLLPLSFSFSHSLTLPIKVDVTRYLERGVKRLIFHSYAHLKQQEFFYFCHTTVANWSVKLSGVVWNLIFSSRWSTKRRAKIMPPPVSTLNSLKPRRLSSPSRCQNCRVRYRFIYEPAPVSFYAKCTWTVILLCWLEERPWALI